MARSAGLGRDVLQRCDRAIRPEKQRQLREMMEIIDKMVPRMGSAVMAFAWYRSQPISGFSGRTAIQLVSEGRAMEVLNYIDAVDVGVQA